MALVAASRGTAAGARGGVRRIDRVLNWVEANLGQTLCIDDAAAVAHVSPAAFARFFHGCRERGVYFAPSQFEAGFLSVAHGQVDLDEVEKITTEVLASL